MKNRKIAIALRILAFILALVMLFFIKNPTLHYCNSGCGEGHQNGVFWESISDNVAGKNVGDAISIIPFNLILIFTYSILYAIFTPSIYSLLYLLALLTILAFPIVVLILTRKKPTPKQKAT